MIINFLFSFVKSPILYRLHIYLLTNTNVRDIISINYDAMNLLKWNWLSIIFILPLYLTKLF